LPKDSDLRTIQNIHFMTDYIINSNTKIRFARENEVGTILSFIKELAEYEKLPNEVTATEELLHKTIFEEHHAQVLFCEVDDTIIGFALFFFNFSTFVGKPGLYLEDLYIKPEMRKRGLGKAFFQVLAQIASENNCGRMEWICLDWNQKSIDFYLNLGAIPLSDWTVYRLTEDKVKGLAGTRD